MSSEGQQGKHRSIQIAHTDKIAAILLCGLAIGVFLVSRDFTGGITRSIGPAFFPRSIMAALAALAVVQFVAAFRSSEPRTVTISSKAIERVLIPTVFLIGYVLLLPVLGFFLITLLFLITFMYYSGVQKFRISIPLAVVISIVLQNTFVGFLQVPLPTGVLPIRDWISLTLVTMSEVYL